MKFQRLFKKNRKEYTTIKVNTSNVPDGLLRKCKKCSSIVLAEDVKNNNYICPKCGGYFRVHAYRRIEMVVDKDSFEPMFEGLNTRNPLKMKGYEAKVQALRDKTGLDEAVTTGRATIGGNSVAIAVCDGRFLMASMGEVVGEKIAKLWSMQQKKIFRLLFLPAQAEQECRREWFLLCRWQRLQQR